MILHATLSGRDLTRPNRPRLHPQHWADRLFDAPMGRANTPDQCVGCRDRLIARVRRRWAETGEPVDRANWSVCRALPARLRWLTRAGGWPPSTSTTPEITIAVIVLWLRPESQSATLVIAAASMAGALFAAACRTVTRRSNTAGTFRYSWRRPQSGNTSRSAPQNPSAPSATASIGARITRRAQSRPAEASVRLPTMTKRSSSWRSTPGPGDRRGDGHDCGRSRTSRVRVEVLAAGSDARNAERTHESGIGRAPSVTSPHALWSGTRTGGSPPSSTTPGGDAEGR